jgi:hypothetical protein
MRYSLESRIYMVCIALTAAMMTSLAYNNSIQPHENVFAQTQEQNQSSQLQVANVTGDLTEATGGNAFGGQPTGDIAINSDGHQTDINGQISATPAERNVFEAWLEDAGGSGYKLSLGQVLENGTIQFSQHMVNPFTYTLFYITEEPENDADPNPAEAKAGIELEDPFGQ